MHWTARLLVFVVAVSGVRCATNGTSRAEPGTAASDLTTVRRELEGWYEENNRAFRAGDVRAIMALRTEDFQTVGPDGTVHDRAAMEERTVGLLNGIDRWIALDTALDSLEVSGDLASAVVHQHLARMALRPDQQVHHVETWVTQNETWRRTPEGWRLYRVEDVRDQRRLVDGRPE